MPSQTDDFVVVADAVKAVLENAGNGLGFLDVYYGDQELIPRTPAATVEPGGIRSELAGAPALALNNIPISIMIYHAGVKNTQVTRKECDQKAMLVRGVLHNDLHLGGLVIHGYCTNIESGYAQRSNTLFRATRITWEGTSKVRLT